MPLALVILLLFYAIYFIKMFLQKKRGIQTRQLGKGKEKNIRIVEIIVSIATFTIIPVQMLHLQILQEEKFLAKTFGEEYIEYPKHTLRYLGKKERVSL